jgi:hypothetical protein
MKMGNKQFVMEDSDIPDLVLEMIIEYMAQATPSNTWGNICAVSRRWDRLARPVLREVFLTTWPRLCTRGLAGLRVSAQGTKVELGRGEDEYLYCFMRPLPLRKVVDAGRPVALQCTPNDTGGVYLAVFLIHS